MRQEIEVGLHILDYQVVDRNGNNCGKVDDVIFEEKNGKLYMTGILVGSKAWMRRIPHWLQVFFEFFIKYPMETYIPFSEISISESVIMLRKTAKDLHLGKGDAAAAVWFKHIPGSGK